MHLELPGVEKDVGVQRGLPSEPLVTVRTLEQIIDAFMDYSDVVLKRFLALVRLLTQIAFINYNFRVLLYSSIMDPLVVPQVLHLLEGHPTDIAGDDQAALVDPHVDLAQQGGEARE